MQRGDFTVRLLFGSPDCSIHDISTIPARVRKLLQSCKSTCNCSNYLSFLVVSGGGKNSQLLATFWRCVVDCQPLATLTLKKVDCQPLATLSLKKVDFLGPCKIQKSTFSPVEPLDLLSPRKVDFLGPCKLTNLIFVARVNL